MLNDWLPLIILLVAFSTGISMLVIKEKSERLRTTVNLTSAAINILLIAVMIAGVAQGEVFETRLPLLPDINLVLKADALSLAFVTLSGVLWFFTTIYAVGYFKHGKHRSRFFSFFSLCVFSTLGVALAGNLITFLIFYELLTLATYPLIVHKGDDASLRSGRTYLRYTMIGGAILMVAVVWLKSMAGALDFSAPSTLLNTPNLNSTYLTIIFIMLIIGLGVKAALFPLHGWLPRAMAAPAPVSSLLHAVAVVKAGAFGIIRVVYDVFGIELAGSLGVLHGLLLLACFTIIYGSVRAIYQDDIKKRLAFSTVSQVSYITLGIALAGPIAAVGAIMHLVHQGLMKITMFFCAGLLAETHHIYKVSDLNGIAKKMPITMTVFTIAIFGMIGIPPIAGFVSKWYLGVGAIEAGNTWVIAILAGSSILNAIYFLPLVYRAWFLSAVEEHQANTLSTIEHVEPHIQSHSLAHQPAKLEAHWMMLLPPVVTITFAILAGLFANSHFSALAWAKLIAASNTIGFSIVESQAEMAFIPLYNASILAWCIVLPLILAVLLLILPRVSLLHYIAPLCAIPAIYLGVQSEQLSLYLPYLFFGSKLQLNQLTQGFLLLAGLLWLLGTSYALFYTHLHMNKSRFLMFFCIAMSSSYGLILSVDMFGFLTFFTFMSLTSYVLIIGDKTPDATAAANTYIKWVILGEVAIFSGFCILNYMELTQQVVEAPLILFMGTMLIIGFGIKIGLLGFHVWLPLAHPVAVVPASALLSGFMVKAGIIGWLKFFPVNLGDYFSLHYVGLITLCLGVTGAFYAALKGIFQKDPKAVLAYSTVSQMGLLSGCFGALIAFPKLEPTMTIAIIFFAVHHGLAKSALFLSVGVSSLLNKANNISFFIRWITLAIIIIPAISLVGVVFTSGFFAKNEVKLLLEDLPYFKYAIVISAIFTALLMCRFIHMLYHKAQSSASHDCKSEYKLLMICIANTALVILTPLYLLNEKEMITIAFAQLTVKNALFSIVPLLLAVALYKLFIVFNVEDRIKITIGLEKPTSIANVLYSNFIKSITNTRERILNSLLSTKMKTFFESKLSSVEVMPLNMQSTYVSLLLICVCTILIIAFVI